MKNMAHIASRVLNTPLLLEPGYARTFFSALAPRLGILELQDNEGTILTGEKMRQSAAAWSSDRERMRSYELTDGVAVLPVSGTLAHKYGYLQPVSGMTGYDGIIKRAEEAFADPEVKGVLMDYDTPGGEVSGCFNTARKLREMADASGKQLWSLCYDMSCSAGMALSSSAHRRLINETGIAGSVGVVMAHADMSKKLEEDGVKVTLIHSGAHKVDGNPYEALGADVLDRFQAESDGLRNEFAQLVADHMGLDVNAVLATEAAVYRGQAAVDVGFADELVNGIDAVSIFSEQLSTQGRTISIGASMSKTDVKPAAETPNATGPAAGEDAPTVQASENTPVTEPSGDNEPDAAAQMQARIAGIMQCEEAKGREATANHLAFNTSMSVDDAKTLLATVEIAKADASDMGNALADAMANEQAPNIGADQATTAQPGNSLVANYEKVTGDK
jgi:ClpP class serine protease